MTRAKCLDNDLFALALPRVARTPAGYLNNKWAIAKVLCVASGCSQTQAERVAAQAARRTRNIQATTTTGPYDADLPARLTAAQADRLQLRVANSEAGDMAELVHKLSMGEV